MHAVLLLNINKTTEFHMPVDTSNQIINLCLDKFICTNLMSTFRNHNLHVVGRAKNWLKAASAC